MQLWKEDKEEDLFKFRITCTITTVSDSAWTIISVSGHITSVDIINNHVIVLVLILQMNLTTSCEPHSSGDITSSFIISWDRLVGKRGVHELIYSLLIGWHKAILSSDWLLVSGTVHKVHLQGLSSIYGFWGLFYF